MSARLLCWIKASARPMGSLVPYKATWILLGILLNGPALSGAGLQGEVSRVPEFTHLHWGPDPKAPREGERGLGNGKKDILKLGTAAFLPRADWALPPHMLFYSVT